MIYEVEIPRTLDLMQSVFYKSSPIKFPGFFLSTSTGRSAMFLILNYLKTTGIIKDKNTTILVPKWLCTSVVHLARKHCSPILSTDHSPKMVLVYHQYGFPQDMDEIMDHCDRMNITIIEDCAHAYEGYYKGKRLGTFGSASIFSFSKIFPSIWGGGLATQNEDLYDFAQKKQDRNHFRWFSLFFHLTKYKSDKKRAKNRSVWNNLRDMSYGSVESAQKINTLSLKIISNNFDKKVLDQRRKNYLFLLDYFKNTDFFSSLEREGIYPYVVPLITSEKRLHRISEALLKRNINTGVYHFDINRNIFNPVFEKCLWVPIHQGLSIKKMSKICDTISSAS